MINIYNNFLVISLTCNADNIAVMRNGRDIPQELETIPDAYKRPGEQEGTLIRLTYDTWESFSYEQHS